MKANQIPKRAEGWIFQGSAGNFIVWRAGKNDYRITKGARGEVIATRDQYGLAFAEACRLDRVAA